jgi:ferredoxin
VLEMREKTTPLYYVACLNKEKGAVAKKACSAACIGCGICLKNCPSEAITLENNVAYINEEKCAQCGTCVEKCPTKAINELV